MQSAEYNVVLVQSELRIVPELAMSRDLVFLGPFILLYFFVTDSVRSEEAHMDSARACTFMHCDPGEHCVNRKFWCKNPPCPSMLYCSKTPRESLKGPTTCASVRCSKGYICLVRVRDCRWDQGCEQQIARCISEREYHDGPASCADFHCPSGHRCILKESLCAYPPCKLFKSCAKSEDVRIWHSKCKTLGCTSEYECFLRRPSDNCPSINLCKHTPDCPVANEVPLNPKCQGWVCPRHQECSAMVSGSCSSADSVENCNTNRTCNGPVPTIGTTVSPSTRLFPLMSSTLANIRDITWPMKDSTDQSGHPTEQTTAAVSSTDARCNPNQSGCRGNWGMQLKKWNPLKNGSIHRAPVYFRSTMNRNNSEAGKPPSEEGPTDNSITEWLDYLRLKTGVDAITVWVKQAEEDRRYAQFKEWLAAVKTTLGPFRFGTWLVEIRKLTSEYPAFQKWLAINEGVPSLTEHRTANEDDTQQKGLREFPDQKPKLEPDCKELRGTTESPIHGHITLPDSHPRERSENHHLIFSVDQEPSNIPMRKNAGHPRINYGRDRGYEHDRDFGFPESKKEMLTWYSINDPPGHAQRQQHNPDHPIKQPDHETDENLPSLDYPTFALPGQRNVGASNETILDSTINSVLQPQKNMWNDSRLQHGVQVHSLGDPLSNEGEHGIDDLMKENDSAQVLARGFAYSGVDPNVLFDNVGDLERNGNLQRRPSVSTEPGHLTETDQRESSQVFGPPESMQHQYYQKVYWQLDPKVLETPTRSQDSLPDIGMKKDKNLTKMYTMFAPAAEELRILSPWDAVRVLDPGEKTYYTLAGFANEKQPGNQMPIIRYPLVVAKVPSFEEANTFPQNARGPVSIAKNLESDANRERKIIPNPWDQIFRYQQIPPLAQSPDRLILEEGKQRIESEKQQAWLESKQRGQNHQRLSMDAPNPVHPVLAPLESSYPRDGRKPDHLEEVSHVSNLPTNPDNAALFTDLEESLKEYVDAYVDAVIEDALSQVILGEQLPETEEPAIWRDLEDPGLLTEDLLAAMGKRIEEQGFVDHLQEAQFPEKKPPKDIALTIPETQMTKDSTPNLSTDPVFTETDYQYGCEDGKVDSPQTMKSDQKSSIIEDTYGRASANDEVEEYYSEDGVEPEYFEESLGYQDGYFGRDHETNLTNYDSQSYEDELST